KLSRRPGRAGDGRGARRLRDQRDRATFTVGRRAPDCLCGAEPAQPLSRSAGGEGDIMASLTATLRERGYRLTLQREIILDALDSFPEHFSPEEVHATFRDRYPQ